MQSKGDIRSYILERREKLDMSIKSEWDRAIFSKLVNSKLYKDSKVIFTYVSFRSEVDTHEIIRYALKDSKIVCVPKISSKEKGIELFGITGLEDLSEGYFGILEPKENCTDVDSNTVDLILMPGAAFDRHGARVGYGKGFYDRFLNSMSKKVNKIALAYDFQVVNQVPMEEYDVRVDGIITNREIMVCHTEETTRK